MSRTRRLPDPMRAACLAAAVLLLAGCAPEGVTAQGAEIQRLYNFFLAAAAGVFVLVVGLIGWSVVRYRRRGDALPVQTHGSTRLELTWTVLPAILVVVLFVATYQTQQRVTAADEDAEITVDVLAFQWSWRFDYTDVGGTDPDTEVVGTPGQVPELVVPVGQTVHINLESTDVVHSFYVPRALFKAQAIPGRTHEFDLTFDEVGVYPGNCAQYCGLAHGDMVFRVRVVAPEQFQEWLEETPTDAET
jgi:cytochrome c oxidase subunit 2